MGPWSPPATLSRTEVGLCHPTRSTAPASNERQQSFVPPFNLSPCQQALSIRFVCADLFLCGAISNLHDPFVLGTKLT